MSDYARLPINSQESQYNLHIFLPGPGHSSQRRSIRVRSPYFFGEEDDLKVVSINHQFPTINMIKARKAAKSGSSLRSEPKGKSLFNELSEKINEFKTEQVGKYCTRIMRSIRSGSSANLQKYNKQRSSVGTLTTKSPQKSTLPHSRFSFDCDMKVRNFASLSKGKSHLKNLDEIVSAVTTPRKNAKVSAYKEHLFQTYQAIKLCRDLPEVSEIEINSKKVEIPRRPGFEGKKTIIFDLDETLVHCVENPLTKPTAIVPVTIPGGDSIKVAINVRPYAKECLLEANKNFEVLVFTASQQCYADAVLDYLDPEGKLVHHRLYRENCLLVNGIYIKDLRIFKGRSLEDLVIVDNAAYSFGYQLDNGVPIISWSEDATDKELLRLIDYMKVLASAPDVRETNRDAFRLHRFCEDYTAKLLSLGSLRAKLSRVKRRFA